MQKRGKYRGAFWFWMGVLIPVLLAMTGFILIGVWPAGDGTVLIIDSLHQYLPFYTDFHEKLTQGGGLLYSFRAGLGYNFWATYAYYLASPFNFLIALVPKANVCDFMDLSILLKIGLCGGTMTWYLRRRNTGSAALPAAFGTMFALSNFMIGYYFNLMWLDSVAMLPLIMAGIEMICGIGKNRCLSDSSDGRLYGLSLFYGVWCNYYIGFMLCIFSVLYFAVCTVTAGRCRVKRFMTRVVRFGGYSLLAGGMGAVVLIPAYRALTNSEAMQSNTLPLTLETFDSFLDMMLTHFAGIKPINIANTQVGLNAYCGVSVLILVLLFALDAKVALRERIARISLAGILLLSFSMKTLNYIWHGFHQQNGLPNRFAFIYIAVVLAMAFDAVKDIREMKIWKIMAGGIVPIVFALVCLIGGFGEDYEKKPYPSSVYLITIALLCGYFALIMLIRLKKLSRRISYLLMSVVCIAEAGASACYGIISNDSVTRSIYLNDQRSYRDLMTTIGDEDWFRSEVDAQRMRNVSLFCGANSVVMFNSTMQESVTNFCDRIGMEARTNKNGYNGVTDLMNDVLGIRYVLSANGTGSTLYGFEDLADDGNLTAYKNEDALPLGFLVNSEITDWDLSGMTPIDVQEDFVRLATGHDAIYTLDRKLSLQNGAENAIRIPEGKQVYLYLPSRVKELVVKTPEYKKTYTTFTDHLYVIEACDGNNEATVTATLNSASAQEAIIYTCPDALEEEVAAELAKNPLENISASGSRLSGTIHADRDGELLITIPYDRNWTCRVDGETVEADLIGEALMGLALTAGDHEIELTYMPDGMIMGLWISLVCAALMILLFVYEKRRGKREQSMNGTGAVTGEVIEEIMDLVTLEEILEKEPMRLHTTFRIGGPADLFVVPKSEENLVKVIKYCRENGIRHFVTGNGSNLLIPDEGYRGVIIQIGKNLSGVRVDENRIEAQAGAMLAMVSRRACEASLTGMEPVSGIPGTLGGAVAMNAGAYGGEMKDIIEQVRVLDRDGEIRVLTNEMMQFAYRSSIVQKEDMIVLSAVLVLKRGDREQILETMKQLRARRQEKQPLDMPSAGSAFRRPEGYYAAALIDQAGLRGYTVGGAQVSVKHCGFIVNTGGATAEDVRLLIDDIRQIVYEQFRVELVPEIKMPGFEDEVQSDF